MPSGSPNDIQYLRGIVRIIAVFLVAISLFASVGSSAGAAPDDSMDLSGHWIDVNLDSLTATAFDGANPVYAAPITSGKPGFETAVGSFHILSRIDHQDMDSATVGIPAGSPNYYYQPDVRYIQYISNNGTAIHGNYWQPASIFGHVNTSHGCIGMPDSDASYFWDFASVGTPVIVHQSDIAVAQSVIGQSVADASATLAAAGLTVQVTEQPDTQSPPGTVISQNPLGGLIPGGTTIALVVSGAPTPQVPTPIATPTVAPTATPVAVPVPRKAQSPSNGLSRVPDIVGLSEADARQLIAQAGLRITYIDYQTVDDVAASSRSSFLAVPAGSVVSVTPPVGTQLPTGSIISVAVRRQ
jgi:hypothetical protein